ncbi:host specificity factor TipJ family phage tail protein, partial [Methylobacterium sp. CM6247]
PSRTDKKDAPTYAIQGIRNQATPDGVIPFILGKVRYAPVYAGLPYTETVGDERYIRALFTFGYGPLRLTNFRIGDTPIEKYKDVQYEVREGYASDAPVTLYPDQVIERALSIELKFAGIGAGPQSRFTAADAANASIDLTFPGGLGGVDKDGRKVAVTLEFAARYRKAGTEAWTNAAPISVTAKLSGKPFTRTFPFSFPERGRYEIELTRNSGDFDNPDQDFSKKEIQRTGRSVWSALRSFRPEYPINFGKPLAVVAVRIRATGQLNGTLDEFNADAQTLCPDWDAATNAYITRETRNPASLFRYVLNGPGITYPLAQNEIDALKEWHAFCVANSLFYNRVHDYEASVLDVLSDIAGAGRASPHDSGTSWGVVVDRALTTITAHITPRNSWGFQGETSYSQFPDAFRVTFLDETNSYAQAERIVPWPGFSGDPKVFEKLDLPGITNPDQVWKETRKRQYELIHRPHSYTVNQDFESLVVTRGDRVELGHDVLDRNQVAARVRTVVGNKVMLDEPVTMEAGKSYACRFRRADGASLIQPVQTIAGTTNTITLTGTGDTPARDDLAMFGEATRETLACTVKGVEAMENFTARLSLVDHAPQIETLVANDVPPAWSGRAGGPAQSIPDVPLAPMVTGIASGKLALDSVTTANPYPVIVSLQAIPLSYVPLASFDVQTRKAGVTAWTTTSRPSGAGAVVIAGYTKGDALEIQARAVSARGTPGEWTASVFHTVAASDATTPINLVAAIERSAINGSTTAAFLRLTCDTPARDDLSLIGRYRATGATAWTAIPLNSSSRTSILAGPLTDGETYTVEGALSTDAGSDISSYIPAAGSPIKAVADANPPAAPTYTSAASSGAGTYSVDHAFKNSVSVNAQAVQVYQAIGFGKVAADAVAVGSPVAGGPSQALTTTTPIDLGLYNYWLRALNGSGVTSAVASGAKTALNLMQANNLSQKPYDLTDAAIWVRTNLSTPTISGTGPDGGAATLLTESTANSSHRFANTVTGLTSGNRVRTALAVKASGRTKGRLDLYDTSLGSSVRFTFDLTAGTITAISTSGALVTAGAGVISKLTADGWWLLTLTGTIAATGAEMRLLFADDASATSYVGDTTKGFLVSAATIAVIA